MNVLKTVIVAPMTTHGFDFVFRVKINFDKKQGLALLDQIRTVDKTRLVKKIGKLNKNQSMAISNMLQEIFAY